MEKASTRKLHGIQSLSQSSKTDKTKQYIYAQIYMISKLYSLKSKETVNIKFKIFFTS